jgi:hypothetical protein
MGVNQIDRDNPPLDQVVVVSVTFGKRVTLERASAATGVGRASAIDKTNAVSAATMAARPVRLCIVFSEISA